MTNAEGLFWLHSDRTYIGPACRRIPVSARVLVDLLGLTFTASDDDIVAHLVLSTHTHHALLILARELQRWGLIDRRLAPSVESSMPRKEQGRTHVDFSLKDLRSKRDSKGA